jgi:hypothetical protein
MMNPPNRKSLLLAKEAKKIPEVTEKQLQRFRSQVGMIEQTFGRKRQKLIEALLHIRITECDGAVTVADDMRKKKLKLPAELRKAALAEHIDHVETMCVLVAINAYETAELNLARNEAIWGPYEKYFKNGRNEGVMPHRGTILYLDPSTGDATLQGSFAADG